MCNPISSSPRFPSSPSGSGSGSGFVYWRRPTHRLRVAAPLPVASRGGGAFRVRTRPGNLLPLFGFFWSESGGARSVCRSQSVCGGARALRRRRSSEPGNPVARVPPNATVRLHAAFGGFSPGVRKRCATAASHPEQITATAARAYVRL